MDDLLVSVARRIRDGDEIPDVDFSRDFASFDDRATAKFANNLWLVCRRFQDDADIRGREADYDQDQRDAVDWHLRAYLKALDGGR